MMKKILVPLDGSDLAVSILPQVAELAQKLEAELTLIHVSPGEEGYVADQKGSTAAEVHKACGAYLSMVARDLQRQGLNVNVVCLRGNPAQEIIRYAYEQQMDLIAMASHGSGQVAWLLGSVANKVISHTSTPVLLFRVLELEPPSLKSEVTPLSEFPI